MPSHCRCCSGHFIEDDVLGDCPGCPECADAVKCHEAIIDETCGEDDKHCLCVPSLRKEIARLIQANEHWHVRVTQLKSENDIIQATLDAHAESEASVCPEDVGCVEYIKVLQAKLGAAHEDVRALKDTLNLVYAVLQKGNKTTWGDTLLYAISTALSRPSVRKIVEGT